MIRQDRTGDTVLVQSREMTGRSITLPRWLGGEGVETTEKKQNKWVPLILPSMLILIQGAKSILVSQDPELDQAV
jgi:hypothetical protein